MKRWWLIIALLLSLGVNAGILATLALSRSGDEPAAPGEPAEVPAASGEEAAAGLPDEEPAAGLTGGNPAALDSAAGPLGPRPGGRDPGGRDPGGPGPRRPLPELAERRLERLAGELGLAGSERERFLELQRGLLAEGARLARERFVLQADLRRELLAAEPDRARVEELIGEIAAVFTRMERTTAEAVLDTRELLDPEQERRYLAVISEMRPRLLRQAEQTVRRRLGERWRRERPPAPAGERPPPPAAP